MKYKVGDKVLVKATITDVESGVHYPYVIMTPTGQKTWATDDDITEVSEDEYNRGLEDACIDEILGDKECRFIDANNLNFEGQHYNKSQINAILDFIDAQPTVYDVEKVVKEVEDLQRLNPSITATEYKYGVIKKIREGGANVREIAEQMKLNN